LKALAGLEERHVGKRSESRKQRIGHDRNMDYPLLSQKAKGKSVQVKGKGE
jgi:hypothetical protein